MAYIDLLQHSLDRFGVITVMNATLYEINATDTGVAHKAVMELDTLKMSNITSEGQQKEIKGGQYADTLIVYNFGRTVNLEFQDAVISTATMSKLWGAKLETTAANITLNGREKAVAGAGTATVLNTIAAIAGVYNETQKKEVAGTFATNVFTATTSADIVATDTVWVYYSYVATSGLYNPVQALIKTSSFPKLVKFVGKTFFLEQQTGKKIEAEIEIPRLQLNANFTLTMESEGDASVFDFTGTALTNADHELIKIKAIRYMAED